MTLPTAEFCQAVLAQGVQIAVVALMVAALVRHCCGRRLHLAYTLWVLVIVKSLTPPIWSSPLGLFSLAQIELREERTARSGALATATHLAPVESASDNTPGPDPRGQPRGPAAIDRSRASQPWHAGAALALAGSVWATGVVFLLAVVGLGSLRCRYVLRRRSRKADPALRRRVAELARRLGIRRSFDVLLSEAPIGPAVFGIVRPKLILPGALLATRDFDDIEPVIAHELIHIRRHDAAVMLIELVAKIVWWFHPLVWWAGRQVGRLRERCCDAETIAGLGYRPARYARSLLDVLEHKQKLRTAFFLPGVRPAEVTLRRLEEIMTRASMFRTRMPRSCWVLALLAGALILPGSPLVIPTEAESGEERATEEVQHKLDRLEDAAWQAGLSQAETKAVLELAKRVACDEKKLMGLRAKGELSDVEAAAVDKLVRQFGSPVEKELAKLREAARQADLTDQELTAAEKVAVRQGFDAKAIVVLYEAGKLSDVEGKALEKLLAVFGHPYADELAELAQRAAEAGLTDAETATLKHGFVRAGCDIGKVVEWKKAGSLSPQEAAALKKLEARFGKLEYHVDNPRDDDLPALLRLARIARMNEAETDALIELFKQADLDERRLLARQQAGELSDDQAGAVAKLEGLFGKLEDFVKDPHRDEIRALIEASLEAELSADQTRALLKLAELVDYDARVAKRLKQADRLTDLEASALEKVESRLTR